MTAAVCDAVAGAAVTVTELTFEGLFLRGIGEAQFQAPIVTTFGVLAALIPAGRAARVDPATTLRAE